MVHNRKAGDPCLEKTGTRTVGTVLPGHCQWVWTSWHSLWQSFKRPSPKKPECPSSGHTLLLVSCQARKPGVLVLPFPALLTWFLHVDNGFLEHQDSFTKAILSNCKKCTVKSVRSTNCWRDAKNNSTNEPNTTVGKPFTICGFIHVLLLPNITFSSWKRYFAINGRAIYWKLKTSFQASHLLPGRSIFSQMAWGRGLREMCCTTHSSETTELAPLTTPLKQCSEEKIFV